MAEGTPFSLGIAQAEIRMDYSGITAGASAAVATFDNSIKTIDQKVRDLGTSVRDTGFALTAMTAPLNIFAGMAVAKSAEFETSLRNIEAIGGLTEDQIGAISDKAAQLGRDTIFAATDALGAFEDMIRDGRKVEDSIGAIDTILSTAAAANMNLADTQVYVSDTLDIFGLSADNAKEAAQSMISAAFSSPATFEEIALSIRNAGVSAASLGIPLNDMNAALAILARQGQRGSEAGTKLRQFFDYLTPSTEAAALAMEEIGVDAFDAEGNFIGLGEVLAQFKEGLADFTEEEQRLLLGDIFGIRASQAAQLLINYDESLEDVLATMMQVNDINDIAAMQMDTFDGSVRSLKGSWEILMVRVGMPFMHNVMRPLVRMAIPVVNLISGWARENPKLVTTILALSGAIGGLGAGMIVLGQLLIFAAPGIGIISGMFAGMSASAIALGAAIAALAFAVTTNLFDIRGKLRGIVVSFGEWLEGLGGGFAAFGRLITDVVNRPFWDNVAEVLRAGLGDKIMQGLDMAFTTARVRLKVLGPENWITILKDLISTIGNVFDYHFDTIPVVNFARSIVESIGNIFRDDEGNVYAFWQDPIGATKDWITTGVNNIIAEIESFFVSPIETINNVADWGSNLITKIVGEVGTVLGTAGNWIIVIKDQMSGLGADILSWIQTNIIDAIFGVGTTAAETSRRDLTAQYAAGGGADWMNSFSETIIAPLPGQLQTGEFTLPAETEQAIKTHIRSMIDAIISNAANVFTNIDNWAISGVTIAAETTSKILDRLAYALISLLFPSSLTRTRTHTFALNRSASAHRSKNFWGGQEGRAAAQAWVNEGIVTYTSTFVAGFTSETNWITALATQLGAKASSTFQKIRDWVSNTMVVLLFGHAPGEYTLTMTGQQAMDTWGSENIKKLGENVKDFFLDTANWLVNFPGEVAEAGSSAIKAVGEWIVEKLVTLLFGPAPQEYALIMDENEIITAWANVNIAQIGAKLSEAFSNVGTWVASFQPTFVNIRNAIFDAILGMFAKDAVDAEKGRIIGEEIAEIDATLMNDMDSQYMDSLMARREALSDAQYDPRLLGTATALLSGTRAAQFAAAAGTLTARAVSLPSTPAFVPAFLAGRLGRTFRGWAGSLAVSLATMAVYYMVPAFSAQFGLSNFVEQIIGGIALSFDKALGTDYVSGTEFEGVIHEWAMNNAAIIQGVVVAGIAAYFKSPLLAFIGLSQILGGLFRDELDKTAERPELTTEEIGKSIEQTLENIRQGILTAVSGLTGGTEEAPSAFALELNTLLEPLFGIGGALSISTFDLIGKLPQAGENIRSFITSIVGEPGAGQTEATTATLESVVDFFSRLGEIIGNILILGTQIPLETLQPMIDEGFGGMAAESVRGLTARPISTFLSTAVLGAIGLAFGGPIVAAIGAFVGFNLPGAIAETIMKGIDADTLATEGISEGEVVASGLYGSIAGAIIGSATGNPVLMAAGVAIGGAVGIGTRDGLIDFFQENPIMNMIISAMFGQAYLATMFQGVSKRRAKEMAARRKGAGVALLAGLFIPDAVDIMSEGITDEMVDSLTPKLVGAIAGFAVFGVVGAAIGAAIGSAIAPAMWAEFWDTMATGAAGEQELEGLEEFLNRSMVLATQGFAAVGGGALMNRAMGAVASGQAGTRAYFATGQKGIGAMMNKLGPAAARFQNMGTLIGGIIAFYAADTLVNQLGPHLAKQISGEEFLDAEEYVKQQAAGGIIGGIAGALIGAATPLGPLMGGYIGFTAGQAFGPAFAEGLGAVLGEINIGAWNAMESISQNAVEIAGIGAAFALLTALTGGGALAALLAGIGASMAYVLADAFFETLLPALFAAISTALNSVGERLETWTYGEPLAPDHKGVLEQAADAFWGLLGLGPNAQEAVPDIEQPIAPSNAIPSPTRGGGQQGGGGLGPTTNIINPFSRDMGGFGKAGIPYYIGTGAQPELFVPRTGGQFYPNADQMMGDNYHININTGVPMGENADEWGGRLGAAFKRQLDRR